MPRMDAFASVSSSGCCFGKLCGYAGEAGPSLDKCGSCGAMHHHLCASENKWLKWISDDKIEGRKCFDCWLLEASLKETVHPLQLQPYYKQLTDWSRVSISPFSIGVSVAALQLLPSFNPCSRLWPAEGCPFVCVYRPSFRCPLSRCSLCARPHSAPASPPPRASAKGASKAVSC